MTTYILHEPLYVACFAMGKPSMLFVIEAPFIDIQNTFILTISSLFFILFFLEIFYIAKRCLSGNGDTFKISAFNKIVLNILRFGFY